jgi:acetyl esterase/lipase
MNAGTFSRLLIAAVLVASPGLAFAQPSPELARAAIALRAPVKGEPEQWMATGPLQGVRNVINPTLTPILPDPAKATGAAVIVAPGGAFRFLSMDNEGWAVARWLADRGVAAFVLKYRTVATPRDEAGFGKSLQAIMSGPRRDDVPLEPTAEAVEDGLAAVRLIRSRAAQWKVDPARVGFVGFSAGAMTALGVGLAPDAAARPNFIAPIYPPMMARPVPAGAPPMFLAIALDDGLFAAGGKSLGLIDAWRQAKVPLEVHLYEKGSHGFGMRGVSAGSALWIDQFHAWLKDRRVIPATGR